MFHMDNVYIAGLKKSFGEKFRHQREAIKGWTLEQAAANLPISRAQIQKYEKGVNFPKVAKLIVIADIFGVSLDDLIGRKILHKAEGAAGPVSEPSTDNHPRKRKAG